MRRFGVLSFVLPLGLAACGGRPPPPVVVTPPPIVTPAPTVIVPPLPVAASRDAMVAQCQGLFAQTLTGRAVSYGTPTVDSVGEVTTVHLTATVTGPAPGVNPRRYTCTFSRGQLTNAVPT